MESIMTRTQKVTVGAVVALALGGGIFEVQRVGQMQAKLQSFERQAQQVNEEGNQLRQERDELATKLKEAQDQPGLLQRNDAELLQLRGEVGRLRNEAQEWARSKATAAAIPAAATNVPVVNPASAELTARAALLYQNLQQRPDRQIPELKLIDQEDWLKAANRVATGSDIEMRKALSVLRTLGKRKFARLAQEALLKYTEANNGNLPTDVLQLKPFFGVPVDEAVLQRYEIAAAGNTGEPGFNAMSTILRERADGLADALYDGRLGISLNSTGMAGGPSMVTPEKE